MSSYDHYSEAKKLAKLLERDSAHSLAEEVLDAMVAGSTGTEIFMLLRMAVKKVLSSPGLPGDTTQLAQVLLENLERSLQ
jgi:DNA transposition AAA+ family ATPase